MSNMHRRCQFINQGHEQETGKEPMFSHASEWEKGQGQRTDLVAEGYFAWRWVVAFKIAVMCHPSLPRSGGRLKQG